MGYTDRERREGPEMYVLRIQGETEFGNRNMKTEIIRVNQESRDLSPEEDRALRRAGEIIKAGGLVAFPTETVYGLGGDALNPESSRKIYAAKGRPSDNPLIVHVCRFDAVGEIAAQVPDTAVRLADAFWPGPLTLILPRASVVPRETTGGLDTVAVRFPSHPAARKLIEYGGGFIAAPSANLSGRPSPTLSRYVVEDMCGRIDAIVDGGTVGIGLESTIVDLTTDIPQILRPGYVTEEMLGEVLGQVETDAGLFLSPGGTAPRAPGMKYRHYAPSGKLVIVEGDADRVISYINVQVGRDRTRGERTGVIATEETRDKYDADIVQSAGSREDAESIAKNLFAVLRKFDDERVTRIYSEGFSSRGLGQAIMNRLLKAAGHCVIKV